MGIVSFANSSRAQVAESMLNNAEIDGKPVSVRRGKRVLYSAAAGAFRKNKRNRIKASKRRQNGSKKKGTKGSKGF